MNVALFGVQTRSLIPEFIQYDIRDEGFARCAAFNRRASLLASGCSDGRVVIWDFLTRAIIKIFVGHVQPVTVVCWSKNSKRLLTASGDCNVVIWNVASGTKAAHFKFESPILHATLHPRNKNVCLVSSHLSEAVEIDLDTFERVRIPIAIPEPPVSSDAPPSDHVPPVDPHPELPDESSMKSVLEHDGIDGVEGDKKEISKEAVVSAMNVDEKEKSGLNRERLGLVEEVLTGDNAFSPIAIYKPDGEGIIVGDSRGYVAVVDGKTKEVKSFFRVANSAHASVKGLVVSGDMKWLLVNSSDRCIRIFDMRKWELHKELYDAVNRQQWKAMVFSPDGEHVLAGAAHRHEHRFYFFSVFSGRMLKNLEGPKEGILDIIWHPTQPVIVSVSTTGTLYVWGTHIDETWSSFTPGFIQLEQNEEYIEREDEFDATDDIDNVPNVPGAPIRKKPKFREPDSTETIDIITVDPLLDDPYFDIPDQDHETNDELIGLATNVIPDKFLLPPRPISSIPAILVATSSNTSS